MLVSKIEIIDELTDALHKANNMDETCHEYNISHEDFYPWMVGWLTATVEHAISKIEQL